jgi:hypothetical protein
MDPAAYAPGTSMPDPGINDPLVLEKLIDLIEAINTKPE